MQDVSNNLSDALSAGSRAITASYQAPYGADGVLRVTEIDGPWGSEFFVEPFLADGSVSPTDAPEYHLTMPGALRAPITYRTSASPAEHEAGWHAEQDPELIAWLNAVPFGADQLPTLAAGDGTALEIETVLQLHPVSEQLSSLVFAVGGSRRSLNLAPYFLVAERLHAATSQSHAVRGMRPIEPARFADEVYLARQGQLEPFGALTSPSPTTSQLLATSPALRTSPEPASVVTPDPTEPVADPSAPVVEPSPIMAAPAGSEPAAMTEPMTQAVDAVGDQSVALVSSGGGQAVVQTLLPMVNKRVLVGDYPQKTLANIVKRVARGAEPQDIVAFLDTGIRAAGKAGLAFTPDAVHICELGEHRLIRYEAIESLTQNGRKVEISIRTAAEAPDTARPAEAHDTARPAEAHDTVRVDVYGVDVAVMAALVAATGLEASSAV